MQYQIIENARIAPNVYLLDLAGDTSMILVKGWKSLQIIFPPGFRRSYIIFMNASISWK